jgi:hypothetical protein
MLWSNSWSLLDIAHFGPSPLSSQWLTLGCYTNCLDHDDILFGSPRWLENFRDMKQLTASINLLTKAGEPTATIDLD